LKENVNEPETITKNRNIRDLYRDIDEFKKGHQPRTNLLKDENGDLVSLFQTDGRITSVSY